MLALNRATPPLEPMERRTAAPDRGAGVDPGQGSKPHGAQIPQRAGTTFPGAADEAQSSRARYFDTCRCGKSSKEIAATLGMAKITVDMHVATMLSKMGALNRYQAIAKAIAKQIDPSP